MPDMCFFSRCGRKFKVRKSGEEEAAGRSVLGCALQTNTHSKTLDPTRSGTCAWDRVLNKHTRQASPCLPGPWVGLQTTLQPLLYQLPSGHGLEHLPGIIPGPCSQLVHRCRPRLALSCLKSVFIWFCYQCLLSQSCVPLNSCCLSSPYPLSLLPFLSGMLSSP